MVHSSRLSVRSPMSDVAKGKEGVPSKASAIWVAFGRGPTTATAPAGPERHWRKRRGPPAGDGLGNRGAIRARLRCTDREHGGTQAVRRRSGSPREPRSEGPRGLLPQNQQPRRIFRQRRGGLAPEPFPCLQPTTSSPPSTPITLPVIQCVPGRHRATMASATSVVVVRR